MVYSAPQDEVIKQFIKKLHLHNKYPISDLAEPAQWKRYAYQADQDIWTQGED